MPKKIIIIITLVSIILVSNAALFTPKKAEADMPIVDVDKQIDKIVVAIWKFVFYPLFKKTLITLVTGGDFKMSWDSVKNWLINDLGFQTVDAVLRAYTGYGLCVDIKSNVGAALKQAYAPDYQPYCLPEDSKIYDISKELITEGSEAAWKRVKEEYYQTFYITQAAYADNDLNQWVSLNNNIQAEKDKKQQHIYLELLVNDGFLGKRVCPEGYKGDPDACPITTPGSMVSEAIKTEISSRSDAMLETTIKEDIASLAGMGVQLALQQLLTDLFASVR